MFGYAWLSIMKLWYACVCKFFVGEVNVGVFGKV